MPKLLNRTYKKARSYLHVFVHPRPELKHPEFEYITSQPPAEDAGRSHPASGGIIYRNMDETVNDKLSIHSSTTMPPETDSVRSVTTKDDYSRDGAYSLGTDEPIHGSNGEVLGREGCATIACERFESDSFIQQSALSPSTASASMICRAGADVWSLWSSLEYGRTQSTQNDICTQPRSPPSPANLQTSHMQHAE
ncbi:hypothetical protein OBBRIDRAFT_498934 [Obba rivulosa]|uniref:Uncharacterized protein n=1 Tax=Obba rivulosa TaxID=1052685 RepID=A0A8E2DTW5_9APHY|nr:hypothetical protein OBBRIDRAFT_498934 [Obba rivulosa]